MRAAIPAALALGDEPAANVHVGLEAREGAPAGGRRHLDPTYGDWSVRRSCRNPYVRTSASSVRNSV